MEEKINEIHNRVARRQRDLNEREETLSKRIDKVNNATYEGRRFYKNVFSAMPYIALALGGTSLSMISSFPAAVVPIISVVGGKLCGDVVESMLSQKFLKNEYLDNSNGSKEKTKAYFEIERENAKCDAYINEYEYNHTLKLDNSKSKCNNVNIDKLTRSKEKYQSKLKDINTKLVLAKNYRIYESKGASFLKHLGKTLLWTGELVLAYAIVKAFACGSFIGTDLVLPFFIGGTMYGGYNMSVMKSRIDIFNKYNKMSQTDVSLDDIESLNKYQKEYIDKIGNIKVVEEYKKCIDELDEEKLNTDPIEKDYSNVKSIFVEPAPIDKRFYKEEEVYPDTIEVIYTENGNKLLRRKK